MFAPEDAGTWEFDGDMAIVNFGPFDEQMNRRHHAGHHRKTALALIESELARHSSALWTITLSTHETPVASRSDPLGQRDKRVVLVVSLLRRGGVPRTQYLVDHEAQHCGCATPAEVIARIEAALARIQVEQGA